MSPIYLIIWPCATILTIWLDGKLHQDPDPGKPWPYWKKFIFGFFLWPIILLITVDERKGASKTVTFLTIFFVVAIIFVFVAAIFNGK
jgi:hypothetical protein